MDPTLIFVLFLALFISLAVLSIMRRSSRIRSLQPGSPMTNHYMPVDSASVDEASAPSQASQHSHHQQSAQHHSTPQHHEAPPVHHH